MDVVWIRKNNHHVATAFEVEHSTSIHSGIVRMLDLALGAAVGQQSTPFLVAPDIRRDEVEQQLCRPAFTRVAELDMRYLSYSKLKEHCDAICLFGDGLKPMLAISERSQRGLKLALVASSPRKGQPPK